MPKLQVNKPGSNKKSQQPQPVLYGYAESKCKHRLLRLEFDDDLAKKVEVTNS